MATTINTGQAQAARGSNPGSRLIRNVTILAGSQLATWALSIVWTVVIPRNLGPRGVGEITIAGAVTGVIAVFAGLGVTTLLIKEIARDHGRAATLLGAALVTRGILAVPALAAVGLYVLFAHSSSEQNTIMWLAAGAMVVQLFTQPLLSAFQALERFEYLAYSDILNKAVSSIAGIALVLMGARAVGIMQMTLVVAGLVLLLNVLWSRGKFRIDWKVDAGSIRTLALDSLPYWTTGLLLSIYMWIDTVMLSFMTSEVVVGYYAVPTRVFATLLFAPAILSTAILPRLSAAYREGGQALRIASRPALELILAMSFPIAAGVALVAQPLIGAIYGPAFDKSVPVLMILALTLPPTYFNIVINQVLIASNRQIAWTKVMVAAAVVNPLINLVLIRHFQSTMHNGAIGAALSLLATEIGMVLAGIYILPPIFDMTSVTRLVRAVMAALGMAVVVWQVSGYGLIAETAAGVVAFAILAIALRVLSREERALLRKMLAKVFNRGSERAYSTTRYHGWDDVSARPFNR